MTRVAARTPLNAAVFLISHPFGAEFRRRELESIPMEPGLRPAKLADLPGAQAAFYEALNEMRERLHRRPPIPPPDELEPIFPYLLSCSRSGFWVAEDEKEILGFSCGILRGRTWYLSALFLRPGWHGRGLGKALLDRSLIPALREKVALRSTYASADPPALALYQRAGMVARFPFMDLTCSAEGLRARPGAPQELGPLELVPLERRPSAAQLRALLELDVVIRGCPRMEDHRFWLEKEGRAGFLLRLKGASDDEGVVGYAYVNEEGFVGPLALRDLTIAESAYALLIMAAAERAKEISLEVPGINGTAIQFLLAKGFRLALGASLLSTAPLGQMDRYSISGPELL